MAESLNPRKAWVEALSGKCMDIFGSEDDAQRAQLELAIERMLHTMPVAMLEALWADRAEAEKTRELRDFEQGAAARLWQLGVAEALRINEFPSVMAHSRDPERVAIGKDWFESVTGARLYEDLVELRTVGALPRHMLVASVTIEVPRERAAEQAYALLEGRVVRPYQTSPSQRFYPGDILRKIEETELSAGEKRSLSRARAMLQKQIARQS